LGNLVADFDERSGENRYISIIMNGRLQLIEQKLIAIDSAAFQNLCDIYIALREQEFISYNRTGSKLGKQKTVKGTPDSFFRLTNGKMIFIEATTQESNIVSKINGDIDKCLDSGKTGVPVDEISKVIVCFNIRLTPALESEIYTYAKTKNVQIELLGIDSLALEIFFRYPILQKDPLGIPVETGQLLPLKNFIEEYNNKAGNLATPLDNEFFHRKNELLEITSNLDSSDIVILSGFPGVGKTKTALEALNLCITENPDYYAYSISKKDVDISEDLRIYLQYEKNYILFIDDANRQLLNFKQVLGVFREKRKGNIKLLITVRDYAFDDVFSECCEYNPCKISINKFSDDEILEIIKSDSFEIKNSKYQKRIIELADGNARLAIMGARLAKIKQEAFLLGDVSDLYDTYFQTFIKDTDIFKNKAKLKTLGVISFFYVINRNNKEFIENLLFDFNIDYHEFNQSVSDLENMELVEIQFDHIRVSEQVTATYFFYKVFIKDEILSFKTLLNNYFPYWKARFTDTIIPSNNSFGYKNVFYKVNSTLNEFYSSIKNEEEKVFEFFSVFWFYKREELIQYFNNKIKFIPEPVNPVFSTNYELNDFVIQRDKALDFLSKLFNHFTESFIPALELSFEYCRKKPESLPEFVRRIRENLLFDEIDERFGFERQVELFNLIINKTKENKDHYLEVFFALSPIFLSHFFQINKGGRKHTITFYEYPLPFYEVTRDFRKRLWETLFEMYESHPQKIFNVIKSFRPGIRGSIIEILEFDLSLLIPFIENKLNPTEFKHIHYIHDFVIWLNREKLKDRSYRNLKSKFYSQEYDYFRKLDWNTLRGRQDYEYKNHEDFQKLKEQDIRSSFIMSCPEDFQALNKTIALSLSLDDKNEWSVFQSLDIIIEENFSKNDELGFQLLESVFHNYPKGLRDLYRTIKVITNQSQSWALKLWELLKTWNNDNKLYWQLSFYGFLPDSFVDNFYKDELLTTIKSINQPCLLFFESFEKFLTLDKDILHTILSIAIAKNESLNLRISYSYLFFEKHANHFFDNFKLISEAYVQQAKFDIHFDHGSNGLQKLIQHDPDFLIEYLTLFYTDTRWSRINAENYMPFIWDLKDHDPLIEKAVDLIIEHVPCFGLGNDALNILFSRLSDEQNRKAKQFILKYIGKNNSDRTKMNTLFNLISQVLIDFFEEAFIYYLSLNANIETFKMISWIGNGCIYNGDVIIGEIHAKKWQELSVIVEKCTNRLELIDIKTYIKQQIESEMKSADWERKRKFSDPDY
jgi:hypothetical protein